MFRVLIVDDHVGMRKTLRDALRCRFPGIGIEEAGSSEEATRSLDVRPPDVMFVDIGLPGENGLSLAGRIRSTNAAVGIIILTNHHDPEYRQAALAIGADRFMSKASSGSHEVVAAVEELMIARGLLAKQA